MSPTVVRLRVKAKLAQFFNAGQKAGAHDPQRDINQGFALRTLGMVSVLPGSLPVGMTLNESQLRKE